MPVDIGMALSGDKALLRAFKAMEDKEQKKHVRKALRVAGKDVQRDVKARVPDDVLREGRPEIQGRTKAETQRRVKVRAAKRSRTGLGIRIGFFEGEQDDTGIEHHLELGTRLSPPQPFMRPALQANRGNLLRRFRESLRELMQAAGRIGRRGR